MMSRASKALVNTLDDHQEFTGVCGAHLLPGPALPRAESDPQYLEAECHLK